MTWTEAFEGYRSPKCEIQQYQSDNLLIVEGTVYITIPHLWWTDLLQYEFKNLINQMNSYSWTVFYVVNLQQTWKILIVNPATGRRNNF